MQPRDREENFRTFYNNTAPTKTTTKRNSVDLPSTNRASTTAGTMTAFQLTPLWEHILRTRKLPETICPRVMFAEFLERLKDPEWQVRQHALRVFVDVLVVMKSRADSYMETLISQLIENLGHQAPTVRKGALDCLRVYLAETAMPETIMLEILDIGLHQKITNEPFGGRLTCGVMLSLPALVQSILHTKKSHFILKTTIDMLVQKMGQVTHQEITLKVLRKMRELIGDCEFMKYMSHGAYREFDLLCSVYGLSEQQDGLIQPTPASFISSESNTNTWRLMAANKPSKLANCWRPSEEDDVRQEKQCINETVLACPAKVIMETEIKINDDTLTMRILEAKDDDICVVEPQVYNKSSTETYGNSLEDEVVCGRLGSARSLHETSSSLVKLLSDSDEMELEEPKNEFYTTVVTPSTPSRTPKRVTFGGEVVKMRTPDSDANSTSNNNHHHHQPLSLHQLLNESDKNNDNRLNDSNNNPATFVLQSPPTTVDSSKTSVLTVDIPYDNTKPLTRPKSGSTSKTPSVITKSPSAVPSSPTNSPKSPTKSPKDSPKSPFKRLSISPVDIIISPRTAHKEIEVLHNLQRDPSPNRALTARRASLKTDELHTSPPATWQPEVAENLDKNSHTQQSIAPLPPPCSWEELGIVAPDTILGLRSGNWSHRLQGISQLEQALKSTENLAMVQPCLETLLRTLLSAECKMEVAEEKHKLLINLITRLPLDNLEDRTVQIMNGLCRQGGAGANRVCKALMQRLPPAAIILKLISQEFLHAKSSRFREHALQMVIFALMTFPSTCFDAETCVTNATYAALNRKRRVRLAALDVLSVLGQISSVTEVLDVVQEIANSRDDGAALVAAVKTRLSRKQLPLVSSEGAVQYSLHVPPSQLTGNTHDNMVKLQNESSNNNNSRTITNEDFDKSTQVNGQRGPDIDWITAGIGSVSPTSLKRRAHKNRVSAKQSFTCVNTQGSATCNASICNTLHRHPTDILPQNKINEDNHHNNINFHHVFASNPYNYGLTTKKLNAEYPYNTTKRLVANSCSDSSIDGRSSDSNYTSSGGSGVSNDPPGKGVGGDCCGDGISGRFTRQTVNSRFPSMDMNTTYRVHKPPIHYPGMGAYAHLQQQQYNMSNTYPKVNYTLKSQQYHNSQLGNRRKIQNQYHQQQQHQQQQSPPYYYINSNTNRAQHFNHHNANSITNTTHRSNCGNQDNFKMLENRSHRDLNNCGDNLDGTYTISPGGTKIPSQQDTAATTEINGRRFVNVDKFLMQSDKSSQTTNENVKDTKPTEAGVNSQVSERQSNNTPTPSVKSTSYSLRTTVSAQSSDESRSLKEDSAAKYDEKTLSNSLNGITTSHNILVEDKNAKSSKEIIDVVTAPLTTVEGRLIEAAENMEVASESPSKWSTGEGILQIEDEVDDYKPKEQIKEENIDDNTGSLASLQSKTESIITQLEDTPPVLSRAQSTKSLIIEEYIEDNTSFVVVEDVQEVENVKTPTDGSQCSSKQNSAKSRPATCRSQSPTIEDIKALSRRNSIAKSMESLYERPPSKHEYIDNTTETSSQSSAQLNSSTVSSLLPLKPHTPLKQKSKTTHFLRSHRKISPVKQSIKMMQAELFPNSLQRFEKPREALMKTFDQLDSSNWEVVMLGLKNMVRLMRYHPENLDTQMHMVCIQLTRSVRNLRSQVARAACTAATELFTLKSRYLEQECDDLVCALLHRTADTNRFIRADATRALESMCDNLTHTKILNILTTKGAVHPNALVRTTTAKLLNRLVERLTCEKIYTMPRDQRDKFFVTGANLLLEGSLDTRSYAKSLFKLLSGHPSYPRLLLDVIPPRTYRNIEKTLKSIR